MENQMFMIDELFNEDTFAFSDRIFALTDDELEVDLDETIEIELATFGL